MPYRNLDEFLIRLEQSGELIHLNDTTHSDILERISRETQASLHKNRALWFEPAEDLPAPTFPVVTNIFGTQKRMAWALGMDDLETLNVRLSKLLDPQLPQSMGGLMSRAGELINLVRNMSMAGNNTAHAPVQQHRYVEQPDATILPLTNIPIAQIICGMPDGKQQLHIGEVIIIDKQTLKLPVDCLDLPNSTSNSVIPAAIVIGGDPAGMWCGLAPLPTGFDPYLLAGWLRGKPVPMTRALTQALSVPANAEIVIEGEILPASDHIMRVTAITHRDGAVFPLICVNDASEETVWLYKAVERLFMPLLKMMLDEVIDINLPTQYGLYSLALVSIENRRRGQAQKVMHGIWGMGKLALTRTVVVVDADVDVQDVGAVATALLANVDFRQDVMWTNGMIYHPRQSEALSSKVGIDATRKLYRHAATVASDIDRRTLANVLGKNWRLFGSSVLILSDTTTLQTTIDAIWQHYPQLYIAIVGEGTDLDDQTALLRIILENLDQERTRISEVGAIAIW